MPRLECDLIMKGGITSGVVYPLAACKLAKVYRLKSVGGSSAGAIAAAAAACAELGRGTGGFARLEHLPTDLSQLVDGRRSRLFTLFQPQPRMRRLFELVTSGLGTSGWKRFNAMVISALRAWWLAGVLGAVPGVLALVLGFVFGGGAQWVSLTAGVLLALIGSGVGIGLRVYRDASRIPAAGFGLTSGATPPGGTEPALTPYLHETFQTLAGRTVDGPPVTFGDLDAAGITLQLMTTNLSRRQPMTMPWATQDYSFDSVHFRTLFPESVVQRMEPDAPAPPTTEREWFSAVRLLQRTPLLPFPARANLPILVAVRMSLSFPGLIAAVPLHAVDYSQPDNQEAVTATRTWRQGHPAATAEEGAAATPKLTYERNWFSDGGICANLPLQFFDSVLPRRPTFAINLASFPPGREKSSKEADNSYLPMHNDDGLRRRQTHLEEAGFGGLMQFGSAIIDTARTWVDEGQQHMPGYRDRIVTVFHDGQEGGMNLNMHERDVTALSQRGACAAERLVDVFAGNQPGVVPTWGWDNHRWLRFRAAMAALSDTLGSFRGGFEANPPGTTPYATWVGGRNGGETNAALPSYPVNGTPRHAVNRRTQGLLDTARDWQQDPADAFTEGAPEPRPTMRLVPSDRVGESGQLR